MATKIFDYPLATSFRRWLDKIPAAKGTAAGDDLAYTPDLIVRPHSLWHSISAFTAAVDWYLDDMGPNVMVPVTLTGTMTIRLMGVRSSAAGAPAVPGNSIARFKRPGGGWNFPLNITNHNGALLCTLLRNAEVEFRWNGTDWTIAAYDGENIGEFYPADADFSLDPKSGITFYRWGALTADRRVTLAQASFNTSSRIIYLRRSLATDAFKLYINGIEGFATDALWLQSGEMLALRWRDDQTYELLFTTMGSPAGLRSLGGTGGGGGDGNAVSIQGRAVSTSAPADGQLLKWSASANMYVPANDLQASGASGTVPTLQTYGGNGNDSADNAAAFNAAGSSGLLLIPGAYRVLQNINLSANLIVMKGAQVRPGSNITVTFTASASVVAGDYQWMDGSLGGRFAGMANLRGEIRALWANGGDLGAQLNNLITWGARQICIPAVPGLIISTPVVGVSGLTIYQHGPQQLAQGITCRVGARRAVFQFVPNGRTVENQKNYEIRNLYLLGSSTSTPACAFWTSSGTLVVPRGDGTVDINGGKGRLVGCATDGHWGIAAWLNTSAEEMECDRCRFYRDGPGDYYTTAARPRVYRRIGPIVLASGNANGELLHTGGTDYLTSRRSHSALSITNADLWNKGGDPESHNVCLLGYVEDVTLDITYMASSTAHICWDANSGDGINNRWARGMLIITRGRDEGPGGVGVPLLLLDNDGVNTLFEHIHILRTSHYSGEVGLVRGQTGSERLVGMIISDVYMYRPGNSGTAIRPLFANVNSSASQHDGQHITAMRQAYSIPYLTAAEHTAGYRAANKSFYMVRNAW